MALREGYRAFREGVTEDTFILGCTSPMLPAAGLVDGMRISIDIFENWTAVKNVFRRVLQAVLLSQKRLYQRRGLPDCTEKGE